MKNGATNITSIADQIQSLQMQDGKAINIDIMEITASMLYIRNLAPANFQFKNLPSWNIFQLETSYQPV